MKKNKATNIIILCGGMGKRMGKFTKKIPGDFKWYNINNKIEMIPSFTKKILNKIEKILL